MKHPKGLWILSVGEGIGRFSYYGLQASFILFLVNHIKLHHSEALQLFGIYSALAFALPVLGGWIGDKLLGLRNAIFIGAFIDLLGSLVIANASSLVFFYIGVAIFLTGIGMFKPNATALVGRLYEAESKSRSDAGVTIFYAFMSLGSIIGPLCYGVLSSSVSWRCAFYSGVAMECVAVICILLGRHHLIAKGAQHIAARLTRKSLTYAFLIALIILVCVVFFEYQYFNVIYMVITAMILVFIISFLLQKDADLRSRVLLTAIIFFFGIFYYACYIQSSSSIILFLNQYVSLHIFGWKIPTQFFTTLEPIFLIALTPLMTKFLKNRGGETVILYRVFWGLLLAAGSFFIFGLSATFLHSLFLKTAFIIGGNFFLGAGELCIGPAVIIAAGRYIPPKYTSTFMGIWWFAISFSYFMGNNLIAKVLVPYRSNHVPGIQYEHVFDDIGLIVLGACLLYVLIMSMLVRTKTMNKIIRKK